MKRVALCVAILIVIVLLCTASLVTVAGYQKTFVAKLEDLETAMYQVSFEELATRSASVCRAWMDAEETLIRFVRHTELDTITGAVTRLEKLAKFGDLSEFSAELDRIKTLIHHVYDSEVPYLRNIF